MLGERVVIRGGTVVDGTGRPGYQADVAVADGRIVEVGEGLTGSSELDAGGCVVSPGFIDIHTHFDAQVFWDPWLTPSAFHGVTSVVAGNCGFSIAPIRPELVPLMAHTLQHVEDMSFDTLSAGVPWGEFETFSQYLDAIERRGVALNYGCYVGHTAVRLYAMGEDAYERQPTDDELRAMQKEVADAMDAGAIGFATSANPLHNGDHGRPIPSRVATLDELRTLLQPLRDTGRGVVAMLPAGVIDNSEMFDLQREIGRPFTWTALVTTQDPAHHQKIMTEMDEAWATGVEIWPQVSCRPIVFQMNMAEPFTFNTRPAFGALMDKSKEERVSAYRDPAWRARAEQEEEGRFRFKWQNYSVAESDNRPDLIGMTVEELAEAWGTSPFEAMLDLSLEDDLQTRFHSALANSDRDGVAWLLPRDHVLLGLADSGAHVSQLCDACFATDLLGNWVRERDVMPIERAVHKLTGEPAGVYGLTDRGVIEAGRAADICVFDPDTVAPGPLRRVRDFPADGERLTADSPEGIRHVLVNGTPIRRDGQPSQAELDSHPGMMLR